MTSIRAIFASLFIVIIGLSTATGAENIYKCGSSYSQTPCTDGKLLSVEDSRDPQQKKDVDTNTRRDAKLARDLEKTRLTQERSTASTPGRQTVNAKTPENLATATTPAAAPTTITPKRIKPKPYKPAGFVALVPEAHPVDSKPKKAKKKAVTTTP